MRKIVCVLFCAVSFLGVCFAQGPELIERTLKGNVSQKYILQLPGRYASENKYPLFIAVHWFNGTAQQQINEWKFLANKKSYILLAPQFSEGYQTLRDKEDDTLVEIIREVENEYAVDRERIYLVGFSGGAQFAHRFAYRQPFIKAVCVLSAGAYDPPPASGNVKTVKYLVGAGEEDERYAKAEKYASLLRKSGFDVVFEGFPLIGHNLHANIKLAVEKFLGSL
jgi:predicted esterase